MTDPTRRAARIAQRVKNHGKMFVFLSEGGLIVKLPAARVAELIAEGAAEPYDAGKGRIQREWAAIVSTSLDDWIATATESEQYVFRGSAEKRTGLVSHFAHSPMPRGDLATAR